MNHLPHRNGNGYSLGELIAEGLTPRESQVLLMRAKGHTAKAIAKTLQCSASNVAQIINSLFFKLGANSSHELITKAFLSKHLRALSCATAIFLALFGTYLQDNTMARLNRTRTTQTLRMQRNNNKKMWS